MYMSAEIMQDNEEDDNDDDDPVAKRPEIRAYKALFTTTISMQQQEYIMVAGKVESTLKSFQDLKKISPALRESFRVLKNAVEAQQIKLKAYQRLLADLLINKEDLALMNLSVLRNQPSLYR